MPSKSKVTTDHEEIRTWAEARGGKPSRVKRTGRGDDPGILRIDFPGYSGADSLEEISWDEFFEKFDENGLALLYQETTSGGQKSNFNKLISRETAKADTGRNGGRGRSRANAGTQARSSRSARGNSRKRTSAQSRRSSETSSRAKARSSSKRRSGSSDEICLPATEVRRLRAGARSQSRNASSKSRSQSSSRSRSTRAVSSKKTSRGNRGNQGRRAA